MKVSLNSPLGGKGTGRHPRKIFADIESNFIETDQRLTAVEAKAGLVAFVSDFSAVGDGVADDAPAIQAGLNALAAAGGGTLFLNPKRYLIGPAGLTIPEKVTFKGEWWPGTQRIPNDYTNLPFTLIVDPVGTIRLGRNAALSGMVIIRKGLVRPTNAAEGLAFIRALAGTAVTVTSFDNFAEKLVILGFDTAVTKSNSSRIRMVDVYADCKNGVLLDNNHDISRLQRVQLFPFCTVNQGWNTTSYSITNAVDNGQGKLRITIGPHVLANGDRVNITKLSGVPNSRGRYTVTVVDENTIDLNESVFSGAYSAGGLATIVANYRDGYGFKVSNSEGAVLIDCFSYSHNKNYWFSDGAGWTKAVACFTDNQLDYAPPDCIGYQIDGTAYASDILGSTITGVGKAVVVDAAGGTAGAHKFTGCDLNCSTENGNQIEVLRGRAVFSGSITHHGNIYVADAADSVIFSGCDNYSATLVTQSETALSKVKIDASTNMLGIKAPAIADGSVVTANTTEGSSNVIPNNCSWWHVNIALPKNAISVQMPSSPKSGQEVTVSTTQNIAALTLLPNTGQNLLGAPTTLAANTSFTYRYLAANSTWVRMR